MNKRKMNKTEYVANHGDYWYCSEIDVWVSVDVRSVPALDLVNAIGLYKDLDPSKVEQSVGETEMGVWSGPKAYTIEEYHQNLCVNVGDKWIYVGTGFKWL